VSTNLGIAGRGGVRLLIGVGDRVQGGHVRAQGEAVVPRMHKEERRFLALNSKKVRLSYRRRGSGETAFRKKKRTGTDHKEEGRKGAPKNCAVKESDSFPCWAGGGRKKKDRGGGELEWGRYRSLMKERSQMQKEECGWEKENRKRKAGHE